MTTPSSTPPTLADLLKDAANSIEALLVCVIDRNVPNEDLEITRITVEAHKAEARDVLAALRAQPAEGPRIRHWLPPTCATCRHWLPENRAEHVRAQCNMGVRSTAEKSSHPITRRDFGCVLFEPLPPAPGEAKE